MMFFIHLIHYKVYLTALKIRNWNEKSREHTVLMYSTAYNLWTFTWFVHFELHFRLKGTEKIHTERFFKFLSNIYSILYGYMSIFWTLQYALFTKTKNRFIKKPVTIKHGGIYIYKYEEVKPKLVQKFPYITKQKSLFVKNIILVILILE